MSGEDLQYRVSRLEGLLDLYSRQEANPGFAGLLGAGDKRKLDGLGRIRLNYAHAADITAGTVLVANTDTLLVAAQTFQSSGPLAMHLVTVTVAAYASFAGSAYSFGLSILLDGVRYRVATDSAAAGGFTQVGNGAFVVTGLSAGAHTARLDVVASAAATVVCRPATAPKYEFAAMQVVELIP